MPNARKSLVWHAQTDNGLICRRALPEKRHIIRLSVSCSKQSSVKYYIQAGAYGTKENADVMVKVLKKKGFSASIRKVSGSVPYRVQVGTYRTKKAANKVVKKLKAAGFTVLVKSL